VARTEPAGSEANRGPTYGVEPPVRRWFLAAVLLAGILAGLGGWSARPPGGWPPGYALDSTLVYRLEVGLVVFAALYSVLVVIRLASYGLTPSRVGTAAIDLPQLAASVGDADVVLTEAEQALRDVYGELANQKRRLDRLEHMLCPHPEDGS
jgi:hypothetical protein